MDAEGIGVCSYAVRVPTVVLPAMKPCTFPSPRAEPLAQLHQRPSLPPCLTDLVHFMLVGLCLKLTQGSSFLDCALYVSFSVSASFSPIT